MSKKAWVTPELNELSVLDTAHGHPISKHVDATRSDGKGHVFFSFS
ncbi:hypothetical protein [Paenibacillus sp. YYML68]|nr:hypothetical protein [Paenibacillus sp. YYML68]